MKSTGVTVKGGDLAPSTHTHTSTQQQQQQQQQKQHKTNTQPTNQSWPVTLGLCDARVSDSVYVWADAAEAQEKRRKEQ
eukprot:2282347-Rhodomonas_salina.1